MCQRVREGEGEKGSWLQGICRYGFARWRDSTGNNSQKAGNRPKPNSLDFTENWSLAVRPHSTLLLFLFPPCLALWTADCTKVKFKKIQHKTLEWRVSFHFVSLRFVSFCAKAQWVPPCAPLPPSLAVVVGVSCFFVCVVVLLLRVRHVRYNLKQLS